jgi:hypothetical protein
MAEVRVMGIRIAFDPEPPLRAVTPTRIDGATIRGPEWCVKGVYRHDVR